MKKFEKYVVIWSDGVVFEGDSYHVTADYLRACLKDDSLKDVEFRFFEIKDNQITELGF